MAPELSNAGDRNRHCQKNIEDRVNEKSKGDFVHSIVRSSGRCHIRPRVSRVCRTFAVDRDGFCYDDGPVWTGVSGFDIVTFGAHRNFPLTVCCHSIIGGVMVRRVACFEEVFCLRSEKKEEDAVQDRESCHVEEQESYKTVRYFKGFRFVQYVKSMLSQR